MMLIKMSAGRFGTLFKGSSLSCRLSTNLGYDQRYEINGVKMMRINQLKRLSTVALKATGVRGEHTLPKLPYEINALEPIISRDIMAVHYTKHHATYVANLNATLQKIEQALSKGDIATVINLQGALKFNGGGHINHSIFWENLSPSGGKPSAALSDAINTAFGSADNMKNKLAAQTVAIQGSGWGWLGYNKETKKLQIATCANQDPLQPTTGLVPIFGIDVWEHAYYLQYKNVRADYVKAIFDIANWEDMSRRFEQATGCN